MRIAFISYEYPPDTAYGGIATYVYQAAKMLRERGHQVEVFAASPYRAGTETENGLLVHRTNVKEQQKFSGSIGQIFAKRHLQVQFDVLEGPEYSADAREALRLVPDIPLVIKLHTPSIFLLRLNYSESSVFRKVRLYFRALSRGLKPAWGYDPKFEAERLHALKTDEVERLHALEADEIASPSKALGEKLIEEWGLSGVKLSHVPYPYIPSDELLKIPVDTRTNVVTFLGRLEVRKGVLDLAQAIPLILRRCPTAKFRFVGSSEPSPKSNLNMREYLEHVLQPYLGSIEFTGHVSSDNITEVLANTDVCTFPSLWENFPCVCLEAMAAARGIVGSNAGGMTDMLNGGEVGKLVPPRSPKKIAEAVIELLKDPELRFRLGKRARDRLLVEYNADRVSAMQEHSYIRALLRRRAIGPRPLRARNC